MDIMSIINQQGGIGAIAEKLGIDNATAERGVTALAPSVATGVENNGLPGAEETTGSAPADQGGLGGLLGGLLGGGGSGGMLGGAGGGLLGSLIAGGVGNQVLGHIFGSKDASRDVAADASQKTGIDPSILKKLLPIVAGMIAMHYMSRRSQGGAAAAPDGGNDGGLLGSIFGNR